MSATASLTTTVTELPESRVRVEAEVAPAEVERQVQLAAVRLGRQLRVPGFRKGKVPAPVVIRRLGRAAVLDEALQTALGGWYAEALDTAGISPIGQPEIDLDELPAAGQPLAFSIEVGVRPTATLGEYRGIEVPRREPTVDDATIDREIEALRERFGSLETVDRPAETGDSVVVDYVGSIDGVPFPGGEARDQLIELGSGRLIPGFEEQLIGARAGEQRTLKVTFPDDYGAAELAGQDAEFTVTVSDVKTKVLPALDDEFAEEAAGFATLAELREDVAKRLREREEHEITHEYERAVLDAVAERAQLEVPAELIHARAHEMVEETLTALGRQGISREIYSQISGQSEHEMAEAAEPEAERSLRREAVIAAVVEAEEIRPSDEEILEALEPTAERNDTTAQELFDRLAQSGRLERMRGELAERKALEWLVEQAKPVPAPASAAPPS
jgi:trigger factor